MVDVEIKVKLEKLKLNFLFSFVINFPKATSDHKLVIYIIPIGEELTTSFHIFIKSLRQFRDLCSSKILFFVCDKSFYRRFFL